MRFVKRFVRTTTMILNYPLYTSWGVFPKATIFIYIPGISLPSTSLYDAAP